MFSFSASCCSELVWLLARCSERCDSCECARELALESFFHLRVSSLRFQKSVSSISFLMSIPNSNQLYQLLYQLSQSYNSRMGNALNQATGDKGSDKDLFSFGKQKTLCGDLSYKTRIIGWLGCSIAGFLLSFIITLVFVLSSFNVTAFAVLYSLGQVLNIAGSCFLSTPSGHLKDMTKKSRIIPSIVYVLSIILTIVIAVATQIKGLVFLFLIIQVLAYYWYTISFIPFGQKILKKSCECCLEGLK